MYIVFDSHETHVRLNVFVYFPCIYTWKHTVLQNYNYIFAYNRKSILRL